MTMRSLLEDFDKQSAEQMSFDQIWSPDIDEALLAEPRERTEDTPVSGRHQDVRLYVAVLLKTYVDMIDAGLVRDAPFEVRLSETVSYRPDIIFVSNNSYDRVHETTIEGAPDIIIEVVTPGSTAIDRGDKFVAYEAGGVREYWLIDPTRELADLYHLGPDGYYDEFRPDIAGRLRSRVLKGFALDLDLLWKRVLPTTPEIVEMAQEMVNQRMTTSR
nr:Uma2 family endonuclease [Anaerolineae bacterium]